MRNSKTVTENRYQVMILRGGIPALVCGPLTAKQAQGFVAGLPNRSLYVEPMPDHYRPECPAK